MERGSFNTSNHFESVLLPTGFSDISFHFEQVVYNYWYKVRLIDAWTSLLGGEYDRTK